MLQGSQVVCVLLAILMTGSNMHGWGLAKAALHAAKPPRNRSRSSWHLSSNALGPPGLLLLLVVALLPGSWPGVHSDGVRSADSSTSRLMASVARRAAQLRLLGARSVALAACS